MLSAQTIKFLHIAPDCSLKQIEATLDALYGAAENDVTEDDEDDF